MLALVTALSLTACGDAAESVATTPVRPDPPATASSAPPATEPPAAEPPATEPPATAPELPTDPPATLPAPIELPAPPAASSWSADLASVRVAEPTSRAGYDRDLFPHWIDADSNRCNTRCEVLFRQFRHDLDGLPDGGWFSAYDAVTTGLSSELDVDHVVPLSEAWVSGADAWDETRRREFANDLAPGALLAVTASSNRSKGDRDPSEWQPPNRASWCGYAADWLRTKVRWDLGVDPLEFTTLSQMLQGCP